MVFLWWFLPLTLSFHSLIKQKASVGDTLTMPCLCKEQGKNLSWLLCPHPHINYQEQAGNYAAVSTLRATASKGCLSSTINCMSLKGICSARQSQAKKKVVSCASAEIGPSNRAWAWSTYRLIAALPRWDSQESRPLRQALKQTWRKTGASLFDDSCWCDKSAAKMSLVHHQCCRETRAEDPYDLVWIPTVLSISSNIFSFKS